MVVQLSNANSCTVHLQPSRASRASSRLTLPNQKMTVTAGTVLSRIQFLRWDGVSKQPSALIDCVIPRDAEAVQAAKDYFLRGAGVHIGRRAPDNRSPLSTVLSNTFYDGMTCWYDSGFNEFDCEGVQCTYGGHAMRLDANVGTSAVLRSSPLNAIGDPSGQYACDNGCTLWADGMGGVGYHCPEDGDGGGDEPGGGGGGSPGSPPACNPQNDPNCHVALSPEDSVLFLNALTTLRPISEFTNSAAAAVCLELYTRFNAMMFSGIDGVVFKGKPDNADGHAGYFYRDTIHVDQDVLDAVRNGTGGLVLQHLLGLALHEAGLAIKNANGTPKYQHADADAPGNYPFPFNHTSPAAISEANACAKYP